MVHITFYTYWEEMIKDSTPSLFYCRMAIPIFMSMEWAIFLTSLDMAPYIKTAPTPKIKYRRSISLIKPIIDL